MAYPLRPGYWNPQIWIWILGIVVGFSQTLAAQTQQASCVVTTRGNTADTLDVTFLVECGSSESSATLHFDVRSVAGPSPSDRKLEIAFLVSAVPDGRFSTVHRQKILLKEGASSVQSSLPFTMNLNSDASGQRMQYWNVRVLEEQRDIEASRGIQANPGSPYMLARLNSGESPPYMLLQRGTQSGTNLAIVENSSTLSTLPIPQNNIVVQDTPVFDLARDVLRITSARHVQSLPEYWHYYLQFRWVALTTECLAQVRTERPQAAEALKQYISAGGMLLLVSSTGQATGQPGQAPSGSEDTGQTAIDDWLLGKQPDNPDRAGWEKPFDASPFLLMRQKNFAGNQEFGEESYEDAGVADKLLRGTLSRNYGRGRIVFLGGDNRFQNSSYASLMSMSIGVSSSSAYDENWPLRNMIASVGKPPIWTFCVIVLLFGLILGPGLLTLTGWIGRRSLMILLVPLISLGATFAIVSYEVLHEGFGTYARVTAVLDIDEASGDAFVWSRQNYFSGWPPREGLSIPKNIFCRPVRGFSLGGRGNIGLNSPENQYTVVHEPERSVWTGVLPARAQQQFMIAHPLKASMPIQVKRVDDKTISLRNLTSEMLPMVICRDGKDGYFFAENVPANAELQLPVLAFDEIAGSLSRLRSEYAPGYPPELRSMGWALGSNQSSVEILDQTWVGALAEQAAQSTIKPYGFVTLIHKCDELFVPLEANTQESLILVTGRASW